MIDLTEWVIPDVYKAQCAQGVPAEAVWIRRKADGKKLVVYIPTEKGKVFHAAPETYVLAEGGRGSAKSTTLRWDAHMRNLMIPGHRALLLRRTFPQLRGSHFANVEREGMLLEQKHKFNQSKFYLKYDNESVLQFGHCESDAAVMDYLSQEWDWIGFDELTTFTYDQFIRISASARNVEGSGKLSLVRGATNPIGIGASWVKQYFIDKNPSEEDAPDYEPWKWKSIKMNIVDNPHLNRKEYTAKLQMLGSQSLRKAYIDGEWLVEGQFFHQFAERKDGKAWHVIQELPKIQGVPICYVPWIQIIRMVDWGYSEAEPGWCGWVAMLPDGTAILFKEWVFKQLIPQKAAEGIVERSKGLKIRYTMGDPMMWHERTGESIAETFARNGVSMIPANNDRENGWMNVHAWLTTTYNDGVEERPRLQFLAPQEAGTGLGVPYAIRTLPSLQTDPKNPKDTVQGPGIEDHAADAIRYCFANRPAPSHAPRRTLDHLPKELRESIYAEGGGEDLVLGSESVRAR